MTRNQGLMGVIHDRQYRPNTQVLCRHCDTRGNVQEREGREKVGVSGGKLTAMFLTCGVSRFFVGLSRKRWVTYSRCTNCGRQWTD